MTARQVVLTLTPAQARMVNSALSLLEAEDHDDVAHDRYSWQVMDRTRAKVHQAMAAAGVEP